MNIARKSLISASMALLCAVAFGQPKAAPVPIDIPSQRMQDALNALAKQSGLQVVFAVPSVKGKTSPQVQGSYTAEDALKKLLAGTSLSYEFINDSIIAIRAPEEVAGQASATALPSPGTAEGRGGGGNTGTEGTSVTDALRLAQNTGNPSSPGTGESQGEDAKEHSVGESQEEEDPERSGIPEILVTGSKLGTLNMDIRRTADDIQPYVVFDRDVIESSGAQNLEAFFRSRLPMATNAYSNAQRPSILGNTSEVDLRGLGADETLILIDGRRVAGVNRSVTASVGQPDINGIPLAAIERIEVLPTTASGIYGGGATGGVINIILRRDYSGMETKFTYGNVFKGDVANRRVDLSAGLNLENGKTNLLLSGSFADSNALLIQERDLVQRGRSHIASTNPNYFYSDFYLPLGATTNIRSNTFTNGQRENLVLKDGTQLGSPITFVPVGYQGISLDGGAALVGNAGRYNLDLARTSQLDSGGLLALSNNPTVAAVMGTVRHEFSPRVQGFLEIGTVENRGSFAHTEVATTDIVIPATAPNNPFQQDIQVAVPAVGVTDELSSDSETVRLVTGLVLRLPMEWVAEADFAWNRSRFSYLGPSNLTSDSISGITNGSLDVLRDVNLFPIELSTYDTPSQTLSPTKSIMTDTVLRLAGPLPWALPGGQIVLSTLLEYRKESFGDAVLSSLGGGQVLLPSRWQSVQSAYMEAQWPLVSSRNRMSGIHSLDFQTAVRGDLYEVTGATFRVSLPSSAPIERNTLRDSSVDPTVGLRYQPTPDVTLRASFGTGYLPPSVHQIVPSSPTTLPFPLSLFGLKDPLRGGEPIGIVTFLSGGNSNLKPEQSKSNSAGFILKPTRLPGLRLALDWTKIEKDDNITTLNMFSQATIDAVAANAPERLIREQPSDGSSFGRITAVDSTMLNIARLTVETLDFAATFRLDTGGFGNFDFSANATKMLSLQTQLFPTTPAVENAGVLGDSVAVPGGVKWRANGSIAWSYRNWRLGWTTHFFDSYFLNTNHTVDVNQDSATIPSQIYHDLVGTYKFNPSVGGALNFLSGMEIQCGVSNVLNKKPPIDASARNNPFFYSPLADPRLANYQLTLKKNFE